MNTKDNLRGIFRENVSNYTYYMYVVFQVEVIKSVAVIAICVFSASNLREATKKPYYMFHIHLSNRSLN